MGLNNYKTVIAISTKHSGVPEALRHIHRDIEIYDNEFEKIPAGCISVASADRVNIGKNKYVGCLLEYGAKQVETFYCSEVSIEGQNSAFNIANSEV